MTNDQIAKQVEFCINNNYTPCLEFSPANMAYCINHGDSGLDSSINANYYDNRYWTMWKLPMFGCTDASQVNAEVEQCAKAYPECFIRVVGFDADKQVQCVSFLVYRPEGSAQLSLDARRRA
mgnify:CR=1 FL=1